MDNQNNNFPNSTINNNFANQEPIIPQQNIQENTSPTQNINLPMEFNYYPMPNRKDSMANRGLDGTDFPIKKI